MNFDPLTRRKLKKQGSHGVRKSGLSVVGQDLESPCYAKPPPTPALSFGILCPRDEGEGDPGHFNPIGTMTGGFVETCHSGQGVMASVSRTTRRGCKAKEEGVG